MNKLIFVGLGNNKDNIYQNTRHNIGTMFVDFLAKKYELSWKESKHFWKTTTICKANEIILVKLKTWMNESGMVLQKTIQELKCSPEEIIIFVDNIDLQITKIKLSSHLSNNGHKGINSIKNYLKTKKIPVVHLGVNKQTPVDKWVLSNFNQMEQKQLYEKCFPELQTRICKSLKNSTNKLEFIKQFHRQNIKSKHLAIVGGQWGDEGKGKVVDYFATQNYDVVARFCGGDNAGHTIKVKDQKYEFSILPVSIIQPEVISIIGDACLLNLEKLVSEIELLQKTQKKINLKISEFCHLIMPYHILFDKLEEQKRQGQIIGTTKRGIGPCVQDKVGRFGLRVGDLKNEKQFREKMERVIQTKNLILNKIYNHESLNVNAIVQRQLELFAKIKQYVANIKEICAQNKDKTFLFEGAQGTLLDINCGTYPFVTSSSTTTWQIGNSFGELCHNTKFMGVFKAYSTRVGQGPFWTKLQKSEEAQMKHIVKVGNEIGVVTKRQRLIGWFDAVSARYSCQVNGFHQITFTMLDVLSGIKKIKICDAYIVEGKKITTMPFEQDNPELKCNYITMDGWEEDISRCTNYEDLPSNAQKYVKKIEELLQVPIILISLGPERNQIIKKKSDK